MAIPIKLDPFKITILGAGAWGTAVAIALAKRHDVLLYGRDEHAMRKAAEYRENIGYLPGIRFPDGLQVGSEFNSAIKHVSGDERSLLIVASAISGLRPIANELKSYLIPNLLWLCKGFEEKTQLLPHQVVQEILGHQLAIGGLYGPSFAQEVARGMPCAMTVASDSAMLRNSVVDAVHSRAIRIYTTDDLVGTEVGGAVKNILAIATGATDGLGLGHSARASLIARGLAEITRLGVALGGRTETFMGLAGLGDLILTCAGDLSRNRQVGLGLALGKDLPTIIEELGHVAEGVRCAQAVSDLAKQLGVDMPIVNAVTDVLFHGASLHDMVERLLARDARDEAA